MDTQNLKYASPIVLAWFKEFIKQLFKHKDNN